MFSHLEAITSPNYEIHLLMHDMSKVFDTIERNTLYKDLSEILESDKLMMMNIFLKDVVIQVRYGTTIGEEIQTISM